MPYQETAVVEGTPPAGGAPRYRRDLDREARATVTQITSITTAVTCNGYHGTITTVDPALAAAAEVAFTVNNDVVKAEDVVAVSVKSGPADNEHVIAAVLAVLDGSFQIVLSNLGAAQADGAMEINFRVFPAALV
jgi:hypothetical protein